MKLKEKVSCSKHQKHRSCEEKQLCSAEVAQTVEAAKETAAPISSNEERFYSPLVKNMAKAEGIAQAELDAIPGTGKDGRVTKERYVRLFKN